MRYHAGKATRRIAPREGRIGVPRSLAFDELRVFFDQVLADHGFATAPSDPSAARTLRAGLAHCIDEVCLPLKVFFGHVAELTASGHDTVLVPRLISLARGRNLCPKFHLLPDLIEQAFPGLHVLQPYVDLHHSKRATLEEHLVDACRPMLTELDAWDPHRSPERIAAAYRAEHAAEPAPASTPAADRVTIAVLGHLYAERDAYLGLGVPRRLEQLGAAVVHAPTRALDEPCALEDGMYYEPTVRTARAITRRLADGVDGVVLLTYFACGPDSYSADTFIYRLGRLGIETPMLRLIIDEQTSAEGLETRLATFVDVARHQRDRRGRRC
jgi:predicted nucleotide-binding protein (sugar kinase/HSP70/actin superfamily)